MADPRSGDRPRDQERRVLQHRTRASRGWQGLRVDVGNDGRRPGAAASHARDRVRHRGDDRRRACRYPARCSKGLSRPLAIPPAVGGRTTKSRRQSRRLFPSAGNDCRRPVRTSRSKDDRRALGCGPVASVPFEWPPVVRHEFQRCCDSQIAASNNRRRAQSRLSCFRKCPRISPGLVVYQAPIIPGGSIGTTS